MVSARKTVDEQGATLLNRELAGLALIWKRSLRAGNVRRQTHPHFVMNGNFDLYTQAHV